MHYVHVDEHDTINLFCMFIFSMFNMVNVSMHTITHIRIICHTIRKQLDKWVRPINPDQAGQSGQLGAFQDPPKKFVQVMLAQVHEISCQDPTQQLL